MNDLMIFNNKDFGNVRMVEIEGKVYAVGKDVAVSLGYKNTNDAINKHCKGVVKHDAFKVNGSQIALIPQSDIVRLVVKCPLDGADKFESWIFDEVIPQVLNSGKKLLSPSALKQKVNCLVIADEEQLWNELGKSLFKVKDILLKK